MTRPFQSTSFWMTVAKDDQSYVGWVFSAMDCGTVVNPNAATDKIQGAVVDGISNAFFGALMCKNGAPEQSNFNNYQLIRYNEAPGRLSALCRK